MSVHLFVIAQGQVNGAIDMAIQERIERLSLDELIALGSEGPIEYIEGEIIPVSPTVSGPNAVIRALFRALDHYSLANKLGETFTEASYVTADTSNWVKGSLMPDVMYYQLDRFAAYKVSTPDWRDKPYILVPDLAAEVISPTDLYSKVEQKIAHYLTDGVRIAWVLNPQRKTVLIHQAGSKQQITLTAEDTLDAGQVIPGFSVSVATLFE
jgi:Uma2 family endonuclease